MPIDVEITIKGLVLAHLHDDAWILDFICDKDHDLDLIRKGHEHDPIVLHAGKDRELEFKAGDDPIPGPSKRGEKFGTILNIVRPQMHARENLAHFRLKEETVRVQIVLRGGTLDGMNESDRPYYIQNLQSDGLPPVIIGPVSREMFVKFTIPDGSQLFLKDKDLPDPIGPFSPPSGSLVELTLDNHCNRVPKELCATNDFMGIYEVIRDRKGLKFATGQIAEDPESEALFKEGFKHELPGSGNCDPCTCDPCLG